jgi:protein ImuB
MLWLALHLPRLPLEALAVTLGPEQRGLPLALLKGARLTAVDALAASLGLRPGQKRATAMALAPHTLLGHADAAREQALLASVVQAALVFTPSVACDGIQTVLLEVASTQRAFGGLARLVEQLQLALQPFGLTQSLATAPTAGGASLLARWGVQIPLIGPHTYTLRDLQQLIDPAPLRLLQAGREHHEALLAMGLDCVADLRALPRDGLARRFGPALLAELDAARGDSPEVHAWLSLPEAFEARLELFARADSTEQVLHGAGHLLVRLLTWARARRARVRRFTLDMLHEPRYRHDDLTPACTTLEIALAEPANEIGHLAMLLRENLARMPLPAPTLELRLGCRDLVFSEAPSGELFPTRASEQEGLLRLVERLQARLGREQVLGMQRVADHRPERATRLLPLEPAQLDTAAGTAGAPVGPAPAPSAMPLTRPVWLLPQAQPLADRQSAPWLDGRPLQVLAGPERIETGWWDGEPAVRDYFIAQAHDGTLVWIFRPRLPATTQGSGWFLHGRFA